jgi:hypothetical protein
MNEAESFQSRSDKEIFFEALDKNTPQERAAFLDGACGKNPALRARVEALLADHFEEDAFMEKPAAAREEPLKTIKLGAVVNPNDEAVGQIIGRYKLLEKVGEGGCGAVYVAQQNEPVRRRVARRVCCAAPLCRVSCNEIRHNASGFPAIGRARPVREREANSFEIFGISHLAVDSF